MARRLDDHGVQMTLGRDAARRAYVALSFRAVGVSMWILAGLWALAVVGMSVKLSVGDDPRDWLFSTGWWVFALLAPLFAVVGALSLRLFHVWERRALGEQYGELRLRPRPDPG